MTPFVEAIEQPDLQYSSSFNAGQSNHEEFKQASSQKSGLKPDMISYKSSIDQLKQDEYSNYVRFLSSSNMGSNTSTNKTPYFFKGAASRGGEINNQSEKGSSL